LKPQSLSLCLVLAGALLLPAGLRLLNAFAPQNGLTPSFLPSIEEPRLIQPFDEETADRLRATAPDYAVIGDSMAGTRVVPGQLSRLVGGRGVANVVYPGSNVAYWYLVFKNLIINNPPVHVKAALFFFRDAQLTLAFDRFTPGTLDAVARASEPALDRIVAANALGAWASLHRVVQSAYQSDRARQWLAPALAAAPARVAAPGQNAQAFLDQMNTQVFSLETLRRTESADLPEQTDEMLDFGAMVTRSVLPEIMRLAETNGIRVAFIRVQRRPTAGGPPPQSPALKQYMSDLKKYLEFHGATFVDEWGDPALPLSIYGDGDHITASARIAYTEHLFRNNPRLFQ
jgi:hypothetical protein